jgi:hypothetical protein
MKREISFRIADTGDRPERVDQRHTIEGDNATLRHSAAVVIQVSPCPESPYTFSRRSAVKPIGRRFGTGGCMSWRMAERIAAMASS